MALHGLMGITLGVPEVEPVRSFYEEFGLTAAGDAMATTDGGAQLRLVPRPWRQLVEVVIGADDLDDIARVRAAATSRDLPVADTAAGVALREVHTAVDVRVEVHPRIVQAPAEPDGWNGPGSIGRPNERPGTLFHADDARPRRLGHIALASPDVAASSDFFINVVGCKLSDDVQGIIQFLRCSPDHHNVALVDAPMPFLHHTSWQMESFDAIGHGATRVLNGGPDRHVWGLGRHFLGSNLFWYLRDPAGNYAEYYADLDQIVDDAAWLARSWGPDKALYVWGPPPTEEALKPRDLDEIARAMAQA